MNNREARTRNARASALSDDAFLIEMLHLVQGARTNRVTVTVGEGLRLNHLAAFDGSEMPRVHLPNKTWSHAVEDILDGVESARRRMAMTATERSVEDEVLRSFACGAIINHYETLHGPNEPCERPEARSGEEPLASAPRR